MALAKLDKRSLVALARMHADQRRKRAEPIRWRAALAEAPWAPELPAAQERAFRVAYAERLVEKGQALPARAAAPGTAGGNHSAKRRPLSASDEQWAAWDARAKQARKSFAEWARAWLDAAPGRMP